MDRFRVGRARRAGGHDGDRGRRRRAERHDHGDPRRRPVRHRPAAPAPRPGRARRAPVDAAGSSRSRATTGRASANPRVEALVASTDGFELAEVDLDLRGEGTLMSTAQKGRNDLKLASLRRDRELVAAGPRGGVRDRRRRSVPRRQPAARRRARPAPHRRRRSLPRQELSRHPRSRRDFGTSAEIATQT